MPLGPISGIQSAFPYSPAPFPHLYFATVWGLGMQSAQKQYALKNPSYGLNILLFMLKKKRVTVDHLALFLCSILVAEGEPENEFTKCFKYEPMLSPVPLCKDRMMCSTKYLHENSFLLEFSCQAT